MNNQDERIISCSEFEEHLTDYLDKVLDKETQKAVAAHALRCPLCHALLNEVKAALEICHEISAPKTSMTRLEARILSMTMPETAMECRQFEEHLTDYLDGFLPAPIFHRWERHAALCEKCTDLPGEVVRTIAACYTYKMEELPMPAGLHNKIMQATIGTTKLQKAAWTENLRDWMRGLAFPISVPQLAPVAMMILLLAMFITQTTSAEGSNVYQMSFELAGQTYRQGAEIVLGEQPAQKQSGNPNQEPVQGIFVNQEDK